MSVRVTVTVYVCFEDINFPSKIDAPFSLQSPHTPIFYGKGVRVATPGAVAFLFLSLAHSLVPLLSKRRAPIKRVNDPHSVR